MDFIFIIDSGSVHAMTALSADDLPADCIRDCAREGITAADRWRLALGLRVDRWSGMLFLARQEIWSRAEIADMLDEEITNQVLWFACGHFRDKVSAREAFFLDQPMAA